MLLGSLDTERVSGVLVHLDIVRTDERRDAIQVARAHNFFTVSTDHVFEAPACHESFAAV